MQVGVNYPWRDYGWDFGLGPPTWRGGSTTPRWYPEIDAHLRRFQDIGVRVVRWFILADGLTYGVGAEAPTSDRLAKGGWRFDPPRLSAECLQHFEALLDRFAAAVAESRPTIQLLPVLIDFHFCKPGTRPLAMPAPSNADNPMEDADWVKCGRAQALTDAVKREQFLDRVLEPLLQVSRRHARVIYGWELINEPDWVTRGWHPHFFARPPIPEVAMRAFIEGGVRRIRLAGFRPTVGFASAETLRQARIDLEINQVHHYPNGARTLDCRAFDHECPSVLGEFATASDDVWPDLALDDQRVLPRLRLAHSKGCPLAMPWSFLGQDRHTAWSDEVERDVNAFVRETEEEGQSGSDEGFEE
jgi:hypothetical protein